MVSSNSLKERTPLRNTGSLRISHRAASRGTVKQGYTFFGLKGAMWSGFPKIRRISIKIYGQLSPTPMVFPPRLRCTCTLWHKEEPIWFRMGKRSRVVLEVGVTGWRVCDEWLDGEREWILEWIRKVRGRELKLSWIRYAEGGEVCSEIMVMWAWILCDAAIYSSYIDR